ncbi:hypothetical protein J6590_005008 [Homalodisca vitripennis]|nr:hypothetical protein J6590_005008 [Homalodisca vitripennis]
MERNTIEARYILYLHFNGQSSDRAESSRRLGNARGSFQWPGPFRCLEVLEPKRLICLRLTSAEAVTSQSRRALSDGDLPEVRRFWEEWETEGCRGRGLLELKRHQEVLAGGRGLLELESFQGLRPARGQKVLGGMGDRRLQEAGGLLEPARGQKVLGGMGDRRLQGPGPARSWRAFRDYDLPEARRFWEEWETEGCRKPVPVRVGELSGIATYPRPEEGCRKPVPVRVGELSGIATYPRPEGSGKNGRQKAAGGRGLLETLD